MVSFLRIFAILLGTTSGEDRIVRKSKRTKIRSLLSNGETTIYIAGDAIVNMGDDRRVSIGKAHDVMHVASDGSGNVTEKNVGTEINNKGVIIIKDSSLSGLEKQYSDAFMQFQENLNEYFSQVGAPSNLEEIQKNLHDLIDETHGIKAGELPDDIKKSKWKTKFGIVAKSLLKVLPKTAATLALFNPITAQFSGVIEPGLDVLLQGIQFGL